MTENPQSESTEESLKIVPKTVYSCFAVLGFTTGMYVGWSSSPVVGTFLGGLLSIFSAGSLFLSAKKEDAKFHVTAEQLTLILKSVVLFCLICILGSGVGIAIREAPEWLPIVFAEKEEEPQELIDVSNEGKGMPAGKLTKLQLVQTRLDQLGVPVDRNNAITQQLVSEIASGNDQNSISAKDRLQGLEAALSEARKLAKKLTEPPAQLDALLQQARSRKQQLNLDKMLSSLTAFQESVMALNLRERRAELAKVLEDLKDLEKVIDSPKDFPPPPPEKRFWMTRAEAEKLREIVKRMEEARQGLKTTISKTEQKIDEHNDRMVRLFAFEIEQLKKQAEKDPLFYLEWFAENPEERESSNLFREFKTLGGFLQKQIEEFEKWLGRIEGANKKFNAALQREIDVIKSQNEQLKELIDLMENATAKLAVPDEFEALFDSEEDLERLLESDLEQTLDLLLRIELPQREKPVRQNEASKSRIDSDLKSG